jgi:hypothetical protein
LAQDAYNQKLDEHSFVHRYDPLRDVARQVLAQWQQEDPQEKNDLSEEFWNVMGWLQVILTGVQR